MSKTVAALQAEIKRSQELLKKAKADAVAKEKAEKDKRIAQMTRSIMSAAKKSKLINTDFTGAELTKMFLELIARSEQMKTVVTPNFDPIQNQNTNSYQ